jgi:hypothetical protein
MGKARDRRVAQIQAFRVLVEKTHFNFIIRPQYQFRSKWYNFLDLDGRSLQEYVAIPKLHGMELIGPEFGGAGHRLTRMISECKTWLGDYKKRNGCSAPIIELKAKEKAREIKEKPKKKRETIRCSICNRPIYLRSTKRRKEEIVCVKCRADIDAEKYKENDFFED